MKILAWVFIILGTLSLFGALASTINLWVIPTENFEDWWLDRKTRNKLFIKAVIDFAIAGWLLNSASQTKSRKND